MGQNVGCCSKQSQRDLGRKTVPAKVMNGIQQPILITPEREQTNPYCQQLYGQFHYQSSPIRYLNIKLPLNNKIRTKYVWKDKQIWEYPIQKIRLIPPQVIKKRTFQQKHVWFKCKMDDEKKKYQGMGFNKLKVDPTNVLLSSYQNFKDCNFNLQTKISFQDDKNAIDAGGLFREWVNLSIKQAFSPDLGMFKLCETDQTAYKIVANKSNKQLFLQIAKILGFVMGKSLIQKIPLNCSFNRTIYRILSNQPIQLSDMYNYDIGIYNTLQSIRTNPISEQDLIPFSVRVKDPFTDQQKQYELKPGGRNQYVNADNKEQFIKLMIKFYTYQSIKQIIQSLKYTLYQVIPYNYLEIFQPQQFQMLLCGRQEIDVEDWKRNTVYKGYTVKDVMIVWFWDIVKSFDQKLRGNLLHFCTGSTKVPIQGFRTLQCKRGKLKLFNIKCVQLNKDNPYPKGITCFNKLQLPPYNSKEELYSMLISVCQEQIHDFGLDNVKH